MYPWERFSGEGKRALTLAQEEAERAQRAYIAPEDVLLALVQQESTVAATVLLRVGIDASSVRGRLERELPTSEVLPMAHPGSTLRAKKVIELAFEEARRRANRSVGTHHLLLGLSNVDEATVARVLHDLGATPERIEAQVTAVEASGGRRQRRHDPYSARDNLNPERRGRRQRRLRRAGRVVRGAVFRRAPTQATRPRAAGRLRRAATGGRQAGCRRWLRAGACHEIPARPRRASAGRRPFTKNGRPGATAHTRPRCPRRDHARTGRRRQRVGGNCRPLLDHPP
ncbi:MAG: hypothetical protein E6J14_00060 [Chloroflexi bacterium]|nr:MAG: hypothetical protein E6J14_00060 [Chloroflexota bacterium]